MNTSLQTEPEDMQQDRHVGTVSHSEIKKALSTRQLWGIAIGLVISGRILWVELGWETAGTLGFVITSRAQWPAAFLD